MNAITLKANEHRRIRGGHHWVFSNEIDSADAATGSVVEVRDASGRVFGHGFYNARTLIAARLFAKNYAGDIASYLRDAIRRAARLRERLYPTRTAYRLVFGESDFLPGLIIDRYNSTYVLQVHCLGMEQQLAVVIDCLRDEFGARCILTRHDPHFRRLEGLAEEDTVYLGVPSGEVIDDGSIRFRVGFDDSQKTGFFFDQAANRALIERYCESRSVLDAYCHHGGFGLHAARAGARQVTCVDSSAAALAQAEVNAHENGLVGRMQFVRQDVFGYLADAPQFDVVLIDPPAFAKSRKQLPAALKGYEKLNRLALSRVAPDGLLITSSCSHHLDRETFVRAVGAAAARIGRELQMLHYEGAAPDHPVLPAMPETQYLKCAVFLVLQRPAQRSPDTMAAFADILRADAAALERMLAIGSSATSGDAGRDAKARRIGVNQTRLICGVGFNPQARQRADFARMIGFNSFDALLSERNYRFIHDHYDELTVGNVIDIYTVTGANRQLATELYDPIFSRLQEIESELEGTINPILVSGYKLEIQSIHANHLASPELIARRLQPQYYVLRDIGGELPAMLAAGVMTQPQLLRHPGINVHEKSRLVFQGLLDKEFVREYLNDPSTAPADRDVLQRLLH